MKKTININLGGLVFQIDEDAYDRLNLYLEALKSKFNNIDEQNEIIQDIESRFAELFNSEFGISKDVVSVEMVNKAISTMGEPEEFEEEEILEEDKSNTFSKEPEFATRKLFRDADDQVFVGVISGLSKYFGIQDAIWLRIAVVLLTIASVGIPTIPIYILLWIVMPVAKTSSEKLQMRGNPINLENIENQVKKNINSDEIKRTTARIANKTGEMAPVFFKVIGIGLIILFGLKLIGLTIALFGFSFFISMVNPGYSELLVNSNFTYYVGVFSLYILLATPIVLSIYLAIKIFTKKKVNWIVSFGIAFLLIIASAIGAFTSGFSVMNNFKVNAEQTNYVSLENPTVAELNIEFPYEKLQEDFDLNVNFGPKKKKDKIKLDGFKVLAGNKEIHINNVELDIRINKSDSIFKLSKTMLSKGRNIEDAEEKINHITNEFENLTENTISIPRLMVLEDETKWRNQRIIYKLYMPIGKRIYFGENAKKVIDDVEFNGDYYKRDLADNTWEMTRQGLKCISCD